MHLSVRDISKSFETRGRLLQAVDAVSFDVPSGEFLTLVGPSGCGKSTLLRIIAGLEIPDSGTVEVSGDLHARTVFSIVFQTDALLPWRSVAGNVDLPSEIRENERSVVRRVTEAVLMRVRMLDFSGLLPGQLSGGMRQRTSVARALAHDPEILLLDEPFAHLDAISRALMQQQLLRLVEGTGKSVVYVTHSLDEAVLLSDRVAVMTRRPGRIRSFVPIPIRRPRGEDTLADPAAQRALRQIWAMLREDAEAAMHQVP